MRNLRKLVVVLVAVLAVAMVPVSTEAKPANSLFHPKKHEIVGMSLSDSGTVVAKYGLRDELTVLAEILFGNTVFGEKYVLNGVLSDFQTCWQMDEFLKKTTTYNEIVLSERK
ncbi:MAG: hypothetical protein J5986_00260 [Roseburia sp.]|nr:hypothetical protein [Roseburia sp.]